MKVEKKKIIFVLIVGEYFCYLAHIDQLSRLRGRFHHSRGTHRLRFAALSFIVKRMKQFWAVFLFVAMELFSNKGSLEFKGCHADRPLWNFRVNEVGFNNHYLPTLGNERWVETFPAHLREDLISSIFSLFSKNLLQPNELIILPTE